MSMPCKLATRSVKRVNLVLGKYRDLSISGICWRIHRTDLAGVRDGWAFSVARVATAIAKGKGEMCVRQRVSILRQRSRKVPDALN